MAMTQEHKDALARGRRESKAIKAYLAALGNRKPGRPITPDSVRARIGRIEERLASESDPLRRVDLLQEHIDAKKTLVELSSASDMAVLEDAFVENARTYSERKGITYAAWRAAGVPAAVLEKAEIART